MRIVLVLLAAVPVIAACAKLGPGDPLSNPEGLEGYAGRQTACEDMKCDVISCKKDEKSNCRDFAIWCLEANASYSGDKSAGNCSFKQ